MALAPSDSPASTEEQTDTTEQNPGYTAREKIWRPEELRKLLEEVHDLCRRQGESSVDDFWNGVQSVHQEPRATSALMAKWRDLMARGCGSTLRLWCCPPGESGFIAELEQLQDISGVKRKYEEYRAS